MQKRAFGPAAALLIAALFVLTLSAAAPAERTAVAAAGQTAKQAPIIKKRQLPKGFVYADEAIGGAVYDIRYYSDYNFVGKRIAGYNAPLAVMTAQAAKALDAVNKELLNKGYRLKIYDAYRPKKAVAQFARWSKLPSDTRMKQDFYPNVDKKDLFKLGYIASRSGHSRGSTVDLTIVSKATGKDVDMGGTYDMLDKVSWYGTKLITAKQAANRALLRSVMKKHGFTPYDKEWWHFTLTHEPYPDRYFDFDIE